MVEPGESGLLVPPDDVDALAAALVDLIRHPEWSRRLGVAAASRVADRYDPEDGGRAMMEVYRRTVRVLHVIQGLETGGAERIVVTLAAEAIRGRARGCRCIASRLAPGGA